MFFYHAVLGKYQHAPLTTRRITIDRVFLASRPQRVTAGAATDDNNCLTQIRAGCLTATMKIEGIQIFIHTRESQYVYSVIDW